MDASAFFDYAYEREKIRLARKSGEPFPWTKDKILNKYRFCNVFREDDTVTRWCKRWVRDAVEEEHVLLATNVFRWFNRIETGEAMFKTEAFEAFAIKGDVKILKTVIKSKMPEGPYITGSYRINGTVGMNKLDGVLDCVRAFYHEKRDFAFCGQANWEKVTDYLRKGDSKFSLKEVWEWFCQYPHMGPFTAYEVVCDLYNTPLLSKAPDIMTWANPGPGAMRGLNRIHGRKLKSKAGKVEMLDEMKGLLKASKNPDNWPRSFRRWDMRTVEHTLCEYDKYQRVLNKQGRPRQIFRSEGK